MKRHLNILAAAILFVGCTPENLLRPTIPAVPPSAPATTVKRSEVKSHGPVTPSQITDQNARQKAQELEAEMEADLK
jgi:hypothetical protein